MSAFYTPGIVSTLPVHDGDGYSWGGDTIVTFGDRSINLGTSQNYSACQAIRALAHLIAAAPELVGALQGLLPDFTGGIDPIESNAVIRARAALSKALDEGEGM